MTDITTRFSRGLERITALGETAGDAERELLGAILHRLVDLDLDDLELLHSQFYGDEPAFGPKARRR